MRRLLILHDSADFGGHERMLLALLPGVLDAGGFDDVLFCHAAANERLRAALVPFAARLRTSEWAHVKRRGEPYLRHVRWTYRRDVRRLIAAERPTVVLLVQGRIENLATPLSVLPHGVRVVSYVPMAHRMRDLGRRGGLGDLLRRPLYRRPDAYVVPSRSVAAQLGAAGTIAPVTVAPNAIALPPPLDRNAARRRLALAPSARIALFLGRLDAAQKGVDLLLAAIARRPRTARTRWTYVIVGDGPARSAVEAATRADPEIRLVSWTDEPHLFLSAADVLLMPSRWEGLPLVLLEAMSYGVPVLSSPIDIARELLPAANLVDYRQVDLPAALDRITVDGARSDYLRRARAALASRTLATSARRLAAALELVA